MTARMDKHIRAKCFHPSGKFIEFPKEDIETSIPARFEKIVRLYPHRIAVRTMTQQLTYLELNKAANRLAYALLAGMGTGRQTIGLLFPKGIGLIVSILGAMKAGKICVPLDPTFPQRRLSHMLENAQVDLIVTNGECLPTTKLIGQSGHCLNIDELENARESEKPGIPIAPDDLAYISYTSGSTGLPKGVSENHRNLLFTVRTQTNEYHLCPDDRELFIASAGKVVLRALLNGASVYPVEVKREGLGGLADWLLREEITMFVGVATLFRQFVATLSGAERFPHLRLIKVMGETVLSQDVDLYRKYFSDDCIFVNSYGPSEAGNVADYFIDKKTKITTTSVPIGYSLDGKDVILLDRDGREVKSGTIGEVVVKSRYLSPGYWCRPDLTEAKFQPATSDAGERLYFTGDLGVRDASGCLTHMGRQDSQIKIRGNRVEIPEVEAALLDLENVKEAVVLGREDATGQTQLVAYIIPASQNQPTVTILRKQLAEKLPGFMIPSAFVFLDALPVSGIGKVNRQALPDPGKGRPNLDTPFATPRNTAERFLVQLWAEVLSLDRIGIHDNFFDLGGHSLAAMRVVSEVIKHFQLEIPLQSLFSCPTVAEMAKLITEHQGQQLSSDELKNILSELESLSDEEAARLMNEIGQGDAKN